MIVGVTAPVLLLPEGFTQFSADEVAALCVTNWPTSSATTI